ncbi:MAG: DEAD/DEAH box helicase [Candidatus Hydrothermarchaeaceae archaeon]
MPRSCPRCSSDILITKYGNRYAIVCLRCRLRHAMEAEDEESAFQSFIDAIEKGTIGLSTRDLKELKAEVKREGFEYDDLPQALKALLMQRDSYPVKYKLFPESDARYGSSVEEAQLHPKVKEYLHKRGIRRLYEFQERAMGFIKGGRDVVIVAPTASGKTEAFALPIVEGILSSGKRGRVHALFVYPTKALARDQLKKFKLLEAETGVGFAVYDGDTPREEREAIASSPPAVLVTNPDMLHVHMMQRGSAFKNLALQANVLVLDEIHGYTGAFGTNIHFILKRFQRFKKLQLVGASATIGNPRDFASQLFDREVEVVTEETRKKGPVHFLMVYPIERSDTSIIIDALKNLVWNKYRVLVFANSHKNAEVLGRIAKRNKLKAEIHRAGLTREMRHRTEDGFRSGELDALIATPTLELGIDIGDLDAVVSQLVNFTRLIQRIGRAGRKGQESIAILALRGNDPISTYYKNHPTDYFTDIEPAYIEPKNEVVAYHQILAASMDTPLKGGELAFEEVKEKLAADGLLKSTPRGLAPAMGARRALGKYNIRGIGDSVAITAGKKRIGERSMPMAARELHPGAVYLHGGIAYRSKSFGFMHRVGTAQVERMRDEPVKTEALRFSQPEMVEILEKKRCFSAQLLYCKLRMTEVVHGYVEKDVYSDRKISQKPLSSPIRYTYETRGMVFTAPQPDELVIPGKTGEEVLSGSFHALEHVLIESSNMLVGGGSGEVGGVAMGASGTIFVYDGAPGGNGISKLLYDRFEEAVVRSHKILTECTCTNDDGCPSCTYSYQCGNNNSPLNKAGAISSLESLVGNAKTEVDMDEFADEKPIV